MVSVQANDARANDSQVVRRLNENEQLCHEYLPLLFYL